MGIPRVGMRAIRGRHSPRFTRLPQGQGPTRVRRSASQFRCLSQDNRISSELLTDKRLSSRFSSELLQQRLSSQLLDMIKQDGGYRSSPLALPLLRKALAFEEVLQEKALVFEEYVLALEKKVLALEKDAEKAAFQVQLLQSCVADHQKRVVRPSIGARLGGGFTVCCTIVLYMVYSELAPVH